MAMDYKAMAEGKKGVQGTITADSIRPIRNRVLVHNMHFGEQTTSCLLYTSPSPRDS